MADILDPRLIRAQQAANTHPGNQQYIQFNTVNSTPGEVGRLTWNETDGTLDLGLLGGNVTLQVGQEQVQRINNRTGSAMTDGQAVYVNGSQGNRLTAALALATSDALSARTFGVVTEPIANNQSGFVTTSGLVRNIDTSALPEGAAVYLSPTVPGGLTATRPVAPNHSVLIGWCVRSHHTQGMLFVHVQNGFELDELHNVLITSPADGHVLTYDAATDLWKNEAPTGGGGSGGTYQGAYVPGTTYPANSMVNRAGAVFAAKSSTSSDPKGLVGLYNADLTGSGWTRINCASIASPTVTMINGTNSTTAQIWNQAETVVDASLATTANPILITQEFYLSMTGGADGIQVGFFRSSFTPTAGAHWSAQTGSIGILFDIYNNRISASGGGILTGLTVRTISANSFDLYKIEWIIGKTATGSISATVYRNGALLTTFTWTATAATLTTLREGIVAFAGGIAGTHKVREYRRSSLVYNSTNWEKLFNLP